MSTDADRLAGAAYELESELAGKLYTGKDRKRVVTVVLDRNGAVHDVVVAPDWKKKATATMLGPAVVKAFDDARHQLVDNVSDEFERAGFGDLPVQLRARGSQTAGKEADAREESVEW